jgi:hypothetical protein
MPFQLLKKGETAKAYQKAKMLLSKQALAQQMDQMADMAELSAAQIQANNSMNRMTHMMAQSSRTMSVAQRTMNPEKVSDCLRANSWLSSWQPHDILCCLVSIANDMARL